MPTTAPRHLTTPTESAAVEPLYTKAETAEILNVPLRFIERVTTDHRIRFVRIGRHIRIPHSAIVEYLGRVTSDAR
jgi:excisionase family DNA binding protein